MKAISLKSLKEQPTVASSILDTAEKELLREKDSILKMLLKDGEKALPSIRLSIQRMLVLGIAAGINLQHEIKSLSILMKLCSWESENIAEDAEVAISHLFQKVEGSIAKKKKEMEKTESKGMVG